MKRDFEKYLVQLQKQYTDMNKAIEEVNQSLKDGTMTQEQAAPIMSYYNIVNTNYQRVLYCRYLYNLPPKFIQAIRKKKMEKEAQKFVNEHADKESVVNETQEALDNIKEFVEE